jgi:NADH-quinone oxidoreductase subunit M
LEQGHALLALIVIPLATAGILAFIPEQRKDWVRVFAVFSGAVLFVISIYVFIAYQADGDEQFSFLLRYDWLENVGILGEDGITLYLGIDGIAATMLLLNGIVTFAGTLISWKIEYRNRDFFILFFILTTGVFGTFSSLDLFFFFFFYEIAVLPMYLLIAVWGSSSRFATFYRTKEYSAMKLMLMLVGASVLIFFGIFATFIEAGTGTFSLPDLYAQTYDEDFQKLVFPLFAIGAGCLAGLWPFHTWSPDGHVAAPTAVSMLHAGVLMKLGAFGILRLGIQLFPEGAEFWAPALIALATVNVLYGAISALAQTDFKYVIGYSSVSHMGYVIMGLATLDPVGINGAALQMFSHGVMTALMFAMVGAIYDQAHTRGRTARLLWFHCRVQHLRRHLPRLPVYRRPGHPWGRDHSNLHLQAARAFVLRTVQRRALGQPEGDEPIRGSGRRAADRLHPVHGLVAGALRRPHFANCS